jgi:hypothetical protein
MYDDNEAEERLRKKARVVYMSTSSIDVERKRIDILQAHVLHLQDRIDALAEVLKYSSVIAGCLFGSTVLLLLIL